MRTPKTTALMGLFLCEEWRSLIIAVCSGINGWLTECRVGFNRLRANDMNRDPSNSIHMDNTEQLTESVSILVTKESSQSKF